MSELIPGTYINVSSDESDRINYLVDILINPTIELFRQISINYESGTYIGGNKFRFTYQNWNTGFQPEIFLNGGIDIVEPINYQVDPKMGIITVNFEASKNDSIYATYNFDYFPERVLKGFIIRAISVINTGAVGTPTDYTYEDAPTNWDGVISDLVIAMCMEKLILDYDLWKGRLIFAIGSDALLDGSGDIVSQLETIKRNAEERAYKTMDNSKFKYPNYLAVPTRYYYQSLMLGGGGRVSPHGYGDYGKLRGVKINKLLGTGMTGPAESGV